MGTRVTPVAEGIGAETIETWVGRNPALESAWKAAGKDYRELEMLYGKGKVPLDMTIGSRSYQINEAYVEHLIKEGYTVLDLGGEAGSHSYDMEATRLFKGVGR